MFFAAHPGHLVLTRISRASWEARLPENASLVGGLFLWQAASVSRGLSEVTLGMLVLWTLLLRFPCHLMKLLRKAWYLRLELHGLRGICTTLGKTFSL